MTVPTSMARSKLEAVVHEIDERHHSSRDGTDILPLSVAQETA